MLLAEAKNRVALLKIQPYRWFAISGILATFGNGLIYITIAWYAYEQTKSVGAIALLMFFIWLPSILFGPIFGVCADRYNRKHLMVMSNVVRGLAALVFAILLAAGHNPNIYILARIMGIFV
jgi:MFS family permease